MELMLDTANLGKIERAIRIYPVSAVTCNPSILKKEGGDDFGSTILSLKKILGTIPLHIQVIGPDSEEMVEEGRLLSERFDNVFIKVPVTENGLEAIKILSSEGIQVTATAIYSSIQGILAAAAGAEYLAVYCNRMENLNIDYAHVIADIAVACGKSRILGASFKNAGQVVRAIASGAHAVTVDPDILDAAMSSSLIRSSVDAFEKDWHSKYGEEGIFKLLQS